MLLFRCVVPGLDAHAIPECMRLALLSENAGALIAPGCRHISYHDDVVAVRAYYYFKPLPKGQSQNSR